MTENLFMHYFIDFIITKRCNLNCKYCTSRASICSHDCEYNFEQFKQDVDHLFAVGMDFTPVIIGGEPFCNSRIFDYIEYIRSKDSKIPIAIFTNGKYLSTADDLIYARLHALNVSVWITIYNLAGINYSTILQKCTKHVVAYRLNHYNENIAAKCIGRPVVRDCMGIYKLCEHELTDTDGRRRKCMTGGTDDRPICIRAFNGILYYAACLPMLKDIDEKFNTQYESKSIENIDYVRIANIAKPEITFKTVEFCRKHCVYCGTASWSKSERQREEFLYEP